MKIDVRSFLVTLLLMSPSLSIIELISGSYFPNEKVSLVCIIILSILNGYFLKYFIVAPYFFIIGSIYLLIGLIHFYSGIFNIAGLNTIFLFFSLPFYILYFRRSMCHIIPALSYIIALNLFVSAIQQYSCFLDPSWINIFNNYPPQADYNFPENGFGLYRTSGLFNESSQYSIFLALFIIFYLQKIVSNTRVNTFLVVISGIDMIISQSSSAIIILGFYFLYFALINKKFRLPIIFLIILIASLTFDLLYIKITNTLNADGSNDYPRLLFSYQSIADTFSNHFYFGRGLTWGNPSWDIYSIYFSGFGIIGFVFILVFIILTHLKSKFLFPLFFLSTLINGNLLIPINIFLISIIFNYKYLSDEDFNRNGNL